MEEEFPVRVHNNKVPGSIRMVQWGKDRDSELKWKSKSKARAESPDQLKGEMSENRK